MTIGEINKGVVALILVLVLGAGGFLWYSRLYKPAVAAKAVAVAAQQTAEQGLSQAQSELAAAQKNIEDSKSEASKPDDSVARLSLARTAIPDKQRIDDAAIVLTSLARKSGVDTDFKAGGDEASVDAGAEGTLSGAKPIDIEFEAAGSYMEMMQFMSLVQGTVSTKDGKLYTRGRLFNVTSLEIGAPEEDTGGGTSLDGQGGGSTGPILKPGDILFTVTVRMYTSSTDNAQAVGLATDDPAAAPTDSSSTADSAATGDSSTENAPGVAQAGQSGTDGTSAANSAAGAGTPLTQNAETAPGGTSVPAGGAS